MNSLGIGTKWKTTGPRELDWSCDEVFKTSGALSWLWTDKYLQVVITSQNVDFQELQFQIRKFQTRFSDKYLKYFPWNCYRVNTTTPHRSYSTLVKAMAWCRQATSHYLSQCWPRSLAPYGVTRRQWVNLDIANHLLLVVWICPGNGLVPTRQQGFNRTHGDKVEACHLVSSHHNNNKQKTGWEMHRSKSVGMCINSNWKYVEYCNKKITQVIDLFFYETVDDFGIHDLQFWNVFISLLNYKHKNSQACVRRMNR